jgi:hypothetical protein
MRFSGTSIVENTTQNFILENICQHFDAKDVFRKPAIEELASI